MHEAANEPTPSRRSLLGLLAGHQGPPTRRSALGTGVAAFLMPRPQPWRGSSRAAADPDGKLIARCTDFLALDSLIRQWDAGAIEISDDEAGVLIAAWGRKVPNITAIAAGTVDGRRLKAEAALAVFRYRNEVESPDYDALVMSVLADAAGSAVA